jgi:uncharacterized ion transporter superfamily protein YfcC
MRFSSVSQVRPGVPLASVTVLLLLAVSLVAMVCGYEELAVPFLFAGMAGTFLIAGAGAILAFRGSMAPHEAPKSFRLWHPPRDRQSTPSAEARVANEVTP